MERLTGLLLQESKNWLDLAISYEGVISASRIFSNTRILKMILNCRSGFQIHRSAFWVPSSEIPRFQNFLVSGVPQIHGSQDIFFGDFLRMSVWSLAGHSGGQSLSLHVSRTLPFGVPSVTVALWQAQSNRPRKRYYIAFLRKIFSHLSFCVINGYYYFPPRHRGPGGYFHEK